MASNGTKSASASVVPSVITPPALVRRPPPYHTFECGKLHFVFDTSSCRFFRIDEITRQLLELCKTMPLAEAKETLLSRRHVLPEAVDAVAGEVSLMAQHGLFESPNYTVSPEEFERQLAQRYATAWNKLELALAETCNLACTYCYCGTCRDMPSQGLMTETVARQAITWLFAASGKSDTVSITFFGGEPLLNKPVLRVAIQYSQQLAKLHGKKVFYSMTTNGTRLDDEVIGYIKKYNFGLMVSLDGPSDIHNKQCPTRSGQPSFEEAAAGIKKLMARRRSVTVRCTMVHPAPRMINLIRFFEDFGFTRILLGRAVNPVRPSPVDCSEADHADFARQEMEELIPWMLDQLSQGKTPTYYPYGSFVAELDEGKPQATASPFKCGACRGTTTVGADGSLYPCHRFVGMQAWQIGNISTGPDYDRCKQFWRDYRSCTSPHCTSCWLWTQCHGPCPWEMAQADGSFRMPDRYCEHAQAYGERAAYFYDQKQTRIPPTSRPAPESYPPRLAEPQVPPGCVETVRSVTRIIP